MRVDRNAVSGPVLHSIEWFSSSRVSREAKAALQARNESLPTRNAGRYWIFIRVIATRGQRIGVEQPFWGFWVSCAPQKKRPERTGRFADAKNDARDAAVLVRVTRPGLNWSAIQKKSPRQPILKENSTGCC
jgi:hypothetical protein